MFKPWIVVGGVSLSLALSAWVTIEKRAQAGQAVSVCPNTELGESAEDCPWGYVARTLNKAADVRHNLHPLLKQLAPELVHSLKIDARNRNYKNLWGQSINFDEFAKAQIVDPAVLDTLIQTFRVPPRQDRLVHAGMEHTYGYLFSTLRTAFGYKRARWVKDDIELGFGLPRGTLGPKPVEGTLFSNVTAFIGSVAFKDDPFQQSSIRRGLPKVADSVRNFNFSTLKPVRLEERVKVPAFKSLPAREVILRTDIVPFIFVSAAKTNSYLLVYSVLDTANHGARLITAFPVGKSFVDSTLAPAGLGENKPVVTRYNGYIAGLTDFSSPLSGSRTIVYTRE